MALRGGARVGTYEIVAPLGAGGMGEVYRARDTRLHRDVALKILRPVLGDDPDSRARFGREAHTLASLNHPNIAQIYGLEEDAAGLQVLILELVEGETLAERIADHRIGLPDAISIARQIAHGLDAAHDRGIIHRDLKPSNIRITVAGTVKILDFGLAKSTGTIALTNTTTMTAEPATIAGAIVGTWPYMSPEQAQGLPIDRRTDLWSFGVVLYEMVTQHRPFNGATAQQVVFEIVQKRTPAVTGATPGLQRVVGRCLAKDPAERYQSASELARDLDACATAMQSADRGLRALVAVARRPRVAVPAVVAVAAVIGLAGWALHASSMRHWARDEAVPRARVLADQGSYVEAYQLAAAAERYIATDPALRDLWPELSRSFSVETIPEGAEATWKPYADPNAAWQPLGPTPVRDRRLPLGPIRLRIVKAGYRPVEVAAPAAVHRSTLSPEGTTPPEMVGVPAATFNAQYAGIGTLSARIPEYFIDRHEVTNREFKRFVDAGGYATRAYWTEPFVDGDRTLSWEDAMSRFVDPTGRPGPATWDGGAYKEGEEQWPVGGVSWYEAAAYAVFAGRRLPTVYHWFRAANTDDSRFLVALSNFSGKGPAAVGRSEAIGSFGAVDMAGNVREWCWNATGRQRYLLGGSWADPAYMLSRGQLAPPLDRSTTNGFRCAKYSSDPLTPSLTDPITPSPPPAYLSAAPVNEELFDIYRSVYTLDPGNAQAVVESVDDSAAQWRRETVRIKAAYGDETLPAYLFLPKNHQPPYACVIYVPSATAFRRASGATIRPYTYILSSGRALLYPIFKGTLDRYSGPAPTDPIAIRDYTVMWRKDLGRTLDYLHTRTDIDASRIAYLGESLGAEVAPMLLATEPRVSVAILLSGGLSPFFGKLPEINAVNFLPRVRIPVLMVNGAYDSILPLAASQEAMLRQFGTAPAQKRQVVLNSGHGVSAPEVRNDLVREVLAWLDAYLGKT